MGRLGAIAAVLLLACAATAPAAGAQVSIVTPPPNDDSAHAIAISPGSQVTADTSGATIESAEPLTADPKCSPSTGQPANGGSAIAATVWYRVTGNGKPLVVDTFGSQATTDASAAGFDTMLAVYKGTSPSTAAGTFVRCNDDYNTHPFASTLHSRVRFPTDAGQVYLIQAGSFNNGATAFDRGNIHVSLSEQPANDDRANAENLGPGQYNRSNRAAGYELGISEPTTCSGTTYSSTVWFRYSPPTAGLAHFSVTGSQRPVLAVYDAAAPNTQLACAAATASPGSPSIDRSLQAGHTYLVQVGGKDDSTSNTDVDPLEGAFTYDLGFDPDTDGDGQGDNADSDDDNDGVTDGSDAFPRDRSESVDLDHDGQGDNADSDDDGDGVADGQDAFPRSAAESADADGDEQGDNADSDDDNDGVPDASDPFPRDRGESSDADRDGLGDNADPDDDNDGVVDAADRFPLDRAEVRDSDGDGQGDNADPDDDQDGLGDADERAAGADPLDLDSDDDGLSDGSERRGTSPVKADSDKDKLPDGVELGVTRGIAAPSPLLKEPTPQGSSPTRTPRPGRTRRRPTPTATA